MSGHEAIARPRTVRVLYIIFAFASSIPNLSYKVFQLIAFVKGNVHSIKLEQHSYLSSKLEHQIYHGIAHQKRSLCCQLFYDAGRVPYSSHHVIIFITSCM